MHMINIVKKYFTKTPKEDSKTPPGRTFKRILTGEYFGLEKNVTDAVRQKEAQERRIEQIKEHNLKPSHLIKYYHHTDIKEIRVAFQKEVLAEKWNMLHNY